jgi:hypothetical protein
MTKCPKCDLQWESPCDQTACIELFGECISCRRFELTEDEIKQIQSSVALERKAENAKELGLDYAPLEAKYEPFGYFQYDMRLDAWVQNRINNKGVAFYIKEKNNE